MYFYVKYGEQFLCNNLSVLFQPNEAQALLHYRPINSIRVLNNRNMINMRRMVVDVMMPQLISNRYLKLHKKIVSMANLPLNQMQRDCLHSMDIIELVMNETIRYYERENGGTIHRGDILVGYENPFTRNRHARFRLYDYEINFQESMLIVPREGENYTEYIPPPFIAAPDNGRYGRARVMTLNDLISNPTNRNTMAPREDTVPNEDSEPEWLEARPPRNVTVRSNRHIQFVEGVQLSQEDVQTFTSDMYQIMFEDWSNYTRMFDETFKFAQPEVEIEVIPQPPVASVECPICMTEIDSIETVSLGCCVYSFCGDCYSNQYLTKDHRVHQCMMCRTPFSKVQVFQQSMADKIKPKTFCPLIARRTPSQLTEMDDETFSDLPELLPYNENVITEFPPNDIPMTLSELEFPLTISDLDYD
jgi:hypothetical protein